MPKPCEHLFENFVQCLSDSECVRTHPDRKRALADCARSEEQCSTAAEAYSQCRRGLVRYDHGSTAFRFPSVTFFLLVLWVAISFPVCFFG
mmetsp:Transcript_2299/g.3960  ORF Transcript_2299/g.3960 Transcript_2299/m.3960 type:complete len:91 (+) Transcript_2299:1564-1836(+)